MVHFLQRIQTIHEGIPENLLLEFPKKKKSEKNEALFT